MKYEKVLRLTAQFSDIPNPDHMITVTYLVMCFIDRAMAYSATTVFPAEV